MSYVLCDNMDFYKFHLDLNKILNRKIQSCEKMVILSDHTMAVCANAFLFGTGLWYTQRNCCFLILFRVDRLHLENAGRISAQILCFQTSPLPTSPKLAEVTCHTDVWLSCSKGSCRPGQVSYGQFCLHKDLLLLFVLWTVLCYWEIDYELCRCGSG